MRYKRLDLNLLMALRALLAEKSVTRASENLHISQPAMSGMLSRLRDYFEDPLMVQCGREVKLTPLARDLIEPVNEVLLHIDMAIASKVESDLATAQRQFVIAASDYSLVTILLGVLHTVERLAPNISIEIRHPTPTMLSNLENGNLDFVITPEHFVSEKCECIELCHDGFTIVAWEGNNEVGSHMELDQYQAMRHVVYRHNSDSSDSSAFFEHWYDHTHGVDSRRIAFTASGFFQLALLVVSNSNIATIPSKLASEFATLLPIKLSEPAFEVPDVTLHLQWHRYQEFDPVACWLRDEILDAAVRAYNSQPE